MPQPGFDPSTLYGALQPTPSTLSAAPAQPNDYVTGAISSLLQATGIDPTQRDAYQRAQKFTDLLNWTPLGIPQAAYSAGQQIGAGYQHGSVPQMALGTALGALAAVPDTGGLARELAPAAREGITAFHGSPHSFDQFDVSKLGTGEGAQAFGHGLYFAENEGIAKNYRDELSGKNIDSRNYFEGDAVAPDLGKTAQAGRAAAVAALPGLQHSGGVQIANHILDLLEWMQGDPASKFLDHFTVDPQFQPAYKAAADAMGDLRYQYNPGHMYQVNIAADPNRMIDLDKPISQQHPDVQDAFGYKAHTITDDELAARRAKGDNATADWLEAQRTHLDSIGAQKPADAINLKSPAVAQQLQAAGIPGIKYFDQGSRGASEGTRNYVVFHHDLIDILKKYGLPGALGLGSLGALATQQGGQQPQQVTY